MIARTYIQQLLSAFRNSRCRYLCCTTNTNFASNWDEHAFRLALHQWAARFTHKHLVPHLNDLIIVNKPNHIYLFDSEKTAPEEDRYIRLAFLEWLVQQPELED